MVLLTGELGSCQTALREKYYSSMVTVCWYLEFMMGSGSSEEIQGIHFSVKKLSLNPDCCFHI